MTSRKLQKVALILHLNILPKETRIFLEKRIMAHRYGNNKKRKKQVNIVFPEHSGSEKFPDLEGDLMMSSIELI